MSDEYNLNFRNIIFRLPKISHKIQDLGKSISQNEPVLPFFSLGFQYFQHKSFTNLKMIDEFKDTRKVYLVVNPYEPNIENSTNDISHSSKTYLSHTPDRSFYPWWEIFYLFDLGVRSKHSMSCMSIASKDVNDIVKLARKKLSKGTKTDKYIKDDLKPNHTKYNLICSDFGIENKRDVNQETYRLRTLLKQVLVVTNKQADKGSSIFKVYDLMTYGSAKVLTLLSMLYEKIYIYKPLTSDFISRERFIVCSGFHGTKQDISHINKTLNETIKRKDFVLDPFPKLKIPNNFKAHVIKSNTTLVNYIIKNISLTTKYIKSHNYFGDTYETYKKVQTAMNEKWITYFYPQKDIDQGLRNLWKLVQPYIDENKLASEKLMKSLSLETTYSITL
jgi:23S rRNA U2552 (ribose-2'-O)-methylase RlmE/FtsJ